LTKELDALRTELETVREEVQACRRMLLIVATTMALIDGDPSITHRYLRWALAKLETTSLGRLREGAFTASELRQPRNTALELMADRACEMDLSELAEHLEE